MPVSLPSGGIRAKTPAGRWVLLATVLGSGMAMLDSTVVNVALPSIGRSFDTSLAALQWTVNAYTLTLAGLILLGGALGDRYGRRRVFVIGVAWFAVASLLCGIAPNVQMLIAARALQGIGGALLTPGSLAIIQATFHADDRARAVGTWSGLGGVASAIGPFLGGWLVDAVSWRWVFLINLPLAAVTIVVALRTVPETFDPQPRGRFDVSGAALAALALAGVTWALVEAPTSPVPAAIAGAAGVAAGVAFVFVEKRTREPMLPLDIFRVRLFTSVNIVTLFVYGALGAFMLLLVLELQTVAGYSAQQAGLALLPITMVMLLLSARSGDLARRIGPRLQLTVGPLVCAGGLLTLLRIGPDAPYATDVLPGVLIFGLGLAVLVAPLTATVLASVDVSRAGIASGVNNAAARAAGLLTVAGLPALVGLSGDGYRDPGVVDTGFDRALWICAGLLAMGSAVAWFTISTTALAPTEAETGAECAKPCVRMSCDVTGPPLDPGRRAGVGR
ncbi:MFS transporter [Embleya scabrispora]|uniref:MFS transporter n=1 Tax=Embleya scabrispora TaxID=159449 RepID=UPI00035C1723|nr:MFS transporter [Embleya scabrispora]MYS86955.1 DHA2 family efflux MFS transporter permease subunit [Streptomyces sp. SID5474]